MRPIPHLVILLMAFPTLVGAHQRPLSTEDPESIGAGRILLEAGGEYTDHANIPAYGLKGHLLKLPLVGVSVGISSIAEIQIDGGFYNHLTVTQRKRAPFSRMLTFSGDSTTGVEDYVVGAKVRVVPEGEWWPAAGIYFATKLPNATNETGMGMDTMDFYASILLGKTVGPARVVGNFGVAIYSNPWIATAQTDDITYGLSIALTVAPATELLAEVTGQKHSGVLAPPPRTETQNWVKFGARYSSGPWKSDAAFSFNTMHGGEPQYTWMAGVSYIFDAFTVP
ncbi:MAG: hypothetical protein COX57_03625 [Alphaproteobacteria bacterium CG_4_10_14_0_2_um_filter_63_37]|nr:MAG: hypothetical protein AUJ55_11375 [Proteobacteria bacterium CG1_02_64_396]PJA25387.1 MAG: hypothetical protein COX57_03625 [Alphaproteobacteria bacterium CG_4_10_14_0_2_um_filter_63_37]